MLGGGRTIIYVGRQRTPHVASSVKRGRDTLVRKGPGGGWNKRMMKRRLNGAATIIATNEKDGLDNGGC